VSGESRVNLALVGCGDVVHRSYLPALATARDKVRIAACCDPDPVRAEQTARACESWSAGVQAPQDLDAVLEDSQLSGIFNLAPAPAHETISQAALHAGLHVYSEKPLASTPEGALALAGLAAGRDRLLLCAPAIMAAPRFRWLKQVLETGQFGPATLAIGRYANLGPAALLGYQGDPSVHYSANVGPLIDQGVYVLHAMTGLLGEVRQIQALGAQAIPCRRVRYGPHASNNVAVEGCDHILLQLGFENGALAQVLSSFAVPASPGPALEVHTARASFILDDWQHANAPVDVYLDDQHGGGVQGWLRAANQGCEKAVVDDLVGVGALHFVAVMRGEEAPLLSSADACQVLQIVGAARRSIRDGITVELPSAPVPSPSARAAVRER